METKQTNTVRLGRSFFGKESCLRFEHNGATWMLLGKKHGEWSWKKAKLNPAEVGELLLVLEGKAPKAAFFHTFEKDGAKTETRISVNRAEDGPNVFFRIEDQGKPLMPGEQQVLRAFLQRVLFEACTDEWRPDGGEARAH